MENILQDIRFGLRTLVKTPAYTVVALIALALGTGANSAIFSVVNAVLLRPLPYAEPDRVAMVWGNNLNLGDNKFALSMPDYKDYRDQNGVFEQLACFAYDDLNLTSGEVPLHLQGTMVSANFFDTLGVKEATGRLFSPDDGRPGAERVVVLSNGLWKRQFGGGQEILNQTVTLNGSSFTVIGVTPAEFQSPEKGDEAWIVMSLDGGDPVRIPSTASPEALQNRAVRFLKAIARLRPGVAIEKAQNEMMSLASQLEQQYPNTNARLHLNIVPITEEVVGDIKPALVRLLGAVGMVLLIACANVANLLLARAAARQKEIAIRLALGAGRIRLIRQLLTESILLGLLGGVLGLGLAFIGIKVLLAINPPNVPRLDEINIDGRVLGFTLLMAILTGIIFGLIPALQATKPDLNETLKSEGARGSTGGLHKQLVRSALVISEVALTVILLIGAGLMIKSFLALQNIKPGFNPDNVMTVQVNLPTTKYSSKQAMASFYDRALKRLETLPGVEAVGASLVIPLMDRRTSTRFTIDGRPPATPDERLIANFRPISHDYLRAMGIGVLSGRAFTEQDRDQSPPVAIINASFKRRYFPGDDPVGKHLTRASDKISREIVGVVDDARDTDLKDADPGPALYTPYQQTPYPFMGLAVRTSARPESMTSAIRSALMEIDSAQPIYDAKTMRQRVDEAVSQPRLYATLIGVFAGVALALAAVGIYGVLNYSVNQRRQEIGIRMALGAQPGHILKMIVGQGMTMAVIGLGIGVVLAYFLTRYLAGLLYGVGVNDLTIFIGIPLLLAIVSLLSCYFPARRATKVEPMIALRAE